MGAENKRIAKNTIALYIRMLFTMLVSLFASRVVLQSLGVVDYGIYNVVGGFVAMLSFLNLALSNCTQRFIIFYLGKNDSKQLEKVFATTILSHLLLGVLVVLVCEVIGTWYIHNVMVMPENRLYAALWAFHTAVASLFLVIVTVPYYSDIIAHEKMSVYAIVSIVESLFRLGIAYAISISTYDRLKIYAILILLVQFVVQLTYRQYSKRHFWEARFKYTLNYKLLKEMFSFTGWTVIGNLAFTLHSQGTNMLLNYFFGPVVNTARGLAMQVQNAIIQFCNSFQTSVNPQIIKSYASGQVNDMNLLITRSSRISFFLLYFIALPILFETEPILSIWLKQVPSHLVVFVRLSVLISMITALVNPFGTSVSATGNIKRYQIVIGGILLLNIPCSFFFLQLGYAPYIVYIVQFVIECLAMFTRIILFSKQISLNIPDYLKSVVLRIILTFPLCCLLLYGVKENLNCSNVIIEMFIVITLGWLIAAIVIWTLGIKREEKEVLINYIKGRINERK